MGMGFIQYIRLNGTDSMASKRHAVLDANLQRLGGCKKQPVMLSSHLRVQYAFPVIESVCLAVHNTQHSIA
jgi:hypothetical protein